MERGVSYRGIESWHFFFQSFPACFSIPIFFSNFNFNCSISLSLRNLQEQVKKAFCYQELFWPFTAWINCFSDLKNFANSWPSASNFKSFSRSLEQFFLTVGQNNYGNKIPKKYQFYSSNLTNLTFSGGWNLKMTIIRRFLPSSLSAFIFIVICRQKSCYKTGHLLRKSHGIYSSLWYYVLTKLIYPKYIL